MIELFDNLSQLLAVALGCALSMVQYLRSRRTPWFLLSCFYGCFGLGLIYWLLYTSLVPDASPMFYVSDIGWISCFLFLLVLQVGFAERGEHRRTGFLPWLSVVLIVPLTIYYISLGDVLYNLIVGVLMIAILWLALSGLATARRHPQRSAGKRRFHLTMIVYILLENALWLTSYPWRGDSLGNPYFWCDFAVTLSLLALYPAVRKAVAP